MAEHGPNHTDEVTPLVAGGNGGWDPQQRPQLRCPDSYIYICTLIVIKSILTSEPCGPLPQKLF